MPQAHGHGIEHVEREAAVDLRLLRQVGQAPGRRAMFAALVRALEDTQAPVRAKARDSAARTALMLAPWGGGAYPCQGAGAAGAGASASKGAGLMLVRAVVVGVTGTLRYSRKSPKTAVAACCFSRKKSFCQDYIGAQN